MESTNYQTVPDSTRRATRDLGDTGRGALSLAKGAATSLGRTAVGVLAKAPGVGVGSRLFGNETSYQQSRASRAP